MNLLRLKFITCAPNSGHDKKERDHHIIVSKVSNFRVAHSLFITYIFRRSFPANYRRDSCATECFGYSSDHFGIAEYSFLD